MRFTTSARCDTWSGATARGLLPLGVRGAELQPSDSNHDEPSDRGLGRQAAGGCEGVEAVARELVRRDIAPDGAGLCGLGQQVSDQVAELLLRSGEMLTSMHRSAASSVP